MSFTERTSDPLAFLRSGGEMERLIRSHDWSATPIGTPDHWTASLRITLGIMIHSRFPMFLFWGDELRCFYNDAYRPSLGVGSKHPWALGRPGAEVFPEAWPTLKPLLDQVLETGEATWSEDQLIPIDRNGLLENVYWTFSHSAVYDEAGQTVGIFVTCQETTKAVQSFRTLADSQHLLLTAFEQAPVGVALLEADTLTYQMANRFYTALVDRSADQLLGRLLSEAVPELIEQGFDQKLRQVIQTGIPLIASEIGVRLRRAGQLEVVYIDLNYQPRYEPDGRISGVLVVVADVTARVQTRLALEASEARFRSLIEEAPVATCLFVGRDQRIDVANQVMIDIWGKGESVIGRPLAEALPELKGQPFLDLLDHIYTTGESYSAVGAPADLVVDGVLSRYYYDFTYKPLRNAGGEVYAIMDMAVDVTEQIVARQALEASEGRYRILSEELEIKVQTRTEELEASNEELRVSNEEIGTSNEEYAAINEKLEEANVLLLRSNENLEKFAYIASHDLQEPLRKIQQFGDLLRTHYIGGSGEESRYLERMQSAASRMSVLIRDLLNFSRISVQRDTSVAVSLNEVVSAVLLDLELSIQETGAAITVAPLPVIAGDPSQLSQLFLNLVSNALKFRRADEQPQIQVSGRSLPAHQLPAAIRPPRLAKTYYRIDVTDNGIGFDPKYVDRIFEVFQRLHGKSDYAGTGIGLAICEKVAVNHGGGITAHSQPGQGATFSIYLPA